MQLSRQRTRHTFLLQAPADASCNVPCRLRGHGQPLSAHAKLSVPALAERPLRVSRVAASVVSIPTRIDLFLLMLSAAFFLPPKPTPEASSFRAFGPAQNRVAPALVLRSLRRRRIAGPLQRPETVLPSSLCELRRDKPHWFSGSFFTRAQENRKSVSVHRNDFQSQRRKHWALPPGSQPIEPASVRAALV